MVGLHISYDRSINCYDKIHNGCHQYSYSIPVDLPFCYLDLYRINPPGVHNHSCICFAGSVSKWYLDCHYKEKTKVQQDACSFQIIQFRYQRLWFFDFQKLGNMSSIALLAGVPSKELLIVHEELYLSMRKPLKQVVLCTGKYTDSWKHFLMWYFKAFLFDEIWISPVKIGQFVPLWGEVFHYFNHCILVIFQTDQCILQSCNGCM